MTRLDWWRAKRYFKNLDQDTVQAYHSLVKRWEQSEFANYSADDFAFQVMSAAMGDVCDYDMAAFEGTQTDHNFRELIANIAHVWEILRVREFDTAALKDADNLQKVRWYLEDKEIQLKDPMKTLSAAMNALATIIGRVFNRLPRGAIDLMCADDWEAENAFEVELIDVINNPKDMISDVYAALMQTGSVDLRVFRSVANRFLLKAHQISKLEAYVNDKGDVVGQRETAKKPLIPPHNYKGSARETLDAYYKGTFVKALLSAKIPFAVPQARRFEHTHIGLVATTLPKNYQLLEQL